MLKRDKVISICILGVFFSCMQLSSDREAAKKEKMAHSILDEKQYWTLYNNICDSVEHWTLNRLGLYTFKKGEFSYKIDSLLCINSLGNRLITSIHSITEYTDATSDGLIYLLGEKIDTLWYFFRTGAVIIPRSLVRGHDIHQPLSYKQLHSRALRDVYSGYLNRKGEINEEWFTYQFENPGWGGLEDQHVVDWCFKGKRYTNLKDFYIASHLCKVKGNWLQRDTTQPIIPLPEKSNNP